MLVDLPEDWATNPENPSATWLATCIERGWAPESSRIAPGIYDGVTSHDFEHLVEREYPFDPMFDKALNADQRAAAIVATFRDDTPRDYGVCDSYEQVTARWPSLLTDERPFVILVREIRKANEPEQGGWRWHKWGEYIGTGEPQHEYLADEPDFESVWTFHIVEMKRATA